MKDAFVGGRPLVGVASPATLILALGDLAKIRLAIIQLVVVGVIYLNNGI